MGSAPGVAGFTGRGAVLSHGDFHVGNLVSVGNDTVALDWATFGVNPVGADLAHLALSTLQDPVDDYLAAADGVFVPDAVRAGYEATVALMGASRVHWMLSRGVPAPVGYVQFVADNSPV